MQMTRDRRRDDEDSRADDRAHVDRKTFFEAKSPKELRFI
jgi:hypothetical protein